MRISSVAVCLLWLAPGLVIAQGPKPNEAFMKEHPARESTGLVPLPDLGKSSYQGEEGGLYPGGGNTPPKAHLKAGLAMARQIKPLDKDGSPSPDGKIALLTIGYSNAHQESQAFLRLWAMQTDLNPKVVPVDGCENGKGAWAAAEPHGKYWDTVAQRLDAAGVTAQQVEAVWMKQANGVPKAPFPVEVKKLYTDLVADVHNLHDHFPNLKIVYLSSRIYGGWAVTPTCPEPHAYEGAFAFKWLLADQLAGKLNYDPKKGEVVSPWLEWGPYLWADGVKGRSDGKVVWERDDFGVDGTHPTPKGQQKVAGLLMDFLKTDPTSRPWLLRK
jgi:hypothetical protein